MPKGLQRFLRASLLLALLLAASAPTPTPSPRKPAAAAATGAPDWKEIDRLVSEQKFAEAQKSVLAILARARAQQDVKNWTGALVRNVQLEIGLHGYETAVRFLKDEKWPPDLLSRVTLDLFYGQTLVTYARAYAWEIGQRERVESPSVDLKAWTRDQIFEEARGSYLDAWERRQELATLPVGRLSDYLQANNYPPEVRGTLRDAVTYLFVDLLADTSGWTAAQSNSVTRLDLSGLLAAAGGAPPRARFEDPAVHPLEKIVWVLGDLEAWHRAAGRRDAALEAELEKLRRLHAAWTAEADHAVIRRHLEKRLPKDRDISWWSMGMATLADFRRAEEAPDNLVRSLATAEEGAQAYPTSPGGLLCRSIAAGIRAPDYQVSAMASDAAGRRSILATYKNMPALFFRAYAVDLQQRVQSATDYNLLPSGREAKDLVASAAPAASWSVELPATSDYKTHRAFLVPKVEAPGLYVVVASARKDFAPANNRILSVDLILTELVLVTRPEEAAIEARALSGKLGRPVSGAAVTLYQFDWNHRHTPIETQTTDPEGFARFTYTAGREGKSYFLLACHDRDCALDANYLSLVRRSEPAESTRSLLYTDRSIYRPGQTIDWKVLVFHGRYDVGRFQTLAASPVTVSLVDANNQKVDFKTGTTNAFGTASGQFQIPAGRALGNWRLESSAGGSVGLSVEEYKRPTFEVTWKDEQAPARLNRPVTLSGSALYYFGLPVSHGSVVWQVTRQPEIPWWWWGWGRGLSSANRAETVAQGTASLKPDGTFETTFTPRADGRLGEKQKDITYRFLATASVTDEGGETRDASRGFSVGFVAVAASVRMDTGFLREGARSSMTVLRTDLNGAPRTGSGSWRVIELVQPAKPWLPADRPIAADAEVARYATPGDRLRARWEPEPPLDAILHDWPDGRELASGTATHDAKGEARIELPSLAAGAYRLRYETADEWGGKREAFRDFVVAGRKTRLQVAAALIAESPSVPAGGVVRLLAHSGFPDQVLYLELLHDGKPFERRKVTGGENTWIEIPVGEKDRGGFGARLVMLRDHQFIAQTQSLFVPWDDRKLQLSFATFRDKIRPGSLEKWRVTVKAFDRKPVEERAAELLAYMYDRSLDAFRPHTPGDPLSIYPNHTSAGIERASLSEAYAQWVSNQDFASVPPGPSLMPDQLKFLSGYGIGGPGVRRGSVAVEGGVAGRAVASEEKEAMTLNKALPASAPAPASRSELNGRVADSLARKDAGDMSSGPTPLRSNFAETAFWSPHLLTDSSGAAAIEFTVPDSVTSWRVFVHAVTRDLRAGSIEKTTKSFKDLMVRPYVPRFLREGDNAKLKVVVNNASDKSMSGNVSIEILDSSSNVSASQAFGLPPQGGSAAFSAAAGGSADVAFSISVPRQVGTYSFRVTATSSGASDGELRAVPVLPGRMHLVQSRFVSLKDGARRTMSFPDMASHADPTRIDEQLVVTVDAQLFYSLLNALPYLVHYPYECTEQTLNRFVPTAIVSALFRDYPAVAKMAQQLSQRDTRLERWDQNDPNRKMTLEETPWLEEARGGRDTGLELIRVLDPKIASQERDTALEKLIKAQTASGGFPWWPGGPPSPYMTIYILHGFANALEFGADAPRDAVGRAWAYLRQYVREDLERCMAHNGCWEYATFINYTLSSYPDASWYEKAFSPADRQRLLDFSFKHWKDHCPYLKAQLALTLKRMGRAKDAELVWASVMDSARTEPDLGTYWAREDRSWLWYNDTIETQAFALRTLTEVAPKDPRRDGLVQWLFLNKKLNQWKSTKATAEVIASVAHYLKAEGALSAREAVSVSVGTQTVAFTFEPDQYTGRKNQIVIPGDKIDPKTSSTVAVEKQGPGLAFASATWHFSTEQLPAEERGDFFSVSRRYFSRVSTASGFVLKPLAEGTSLSVGDEVEVQISLKSKHAAEYLHLRDPRAAGLEPGVVLSRYKWDLGISWYEETRDSGTNFFFEQLPAGEYTFKYRLRANMAGTFKVAPAAVESMYAPEFAAYSGGNVLTVH